MKMNKHYTTVPLSTGRIYKHVVTHAHSVVNILTSDKTPEKTRRALRRTLQNLFDHTDINRRASLTNVDNVALVLGCTGSQRIHEGREYMRAFTARIKMCRVLQHHNWTTNPRLKRIAALMAAEREAEKRPRARRAERPRVAPVHRAAVVQQIAA